MNRRAFDAYNRGRADAAILAVTGNVVAAARLLRDRCGMARDQAFDEALTVLIGQDAPRVEPDETVQLDSFTCRRAVQ